MLKKKKGENTTDRRQNVACSCSFCQPFERDENKVTILQHRRRKPRGADGTQTSKGYGNSLRPNKLATTFRVESYQAFFWAVSHMLHKQSLEI